MQLTKEKREKKFEEIEREIHLEIIPRLEELKKECINLVVSRIQDKSIDIQEINSESYRTLLLSLREDEELLNKLTFCNVSNFVSEKNFNSLRRQVLDVE